MKSVSIIVTCEEQEQQLRELLPQLLTLQYGGESEVIVVDKLHDKDLEEWLKDMELQYPNLSHTFCSPTSRGVDTQRLALTLGAKSANYEWLVILPVDVKLESDDWIRRLISSLDDQSDIVVAIIDQKRRWNRFTSYLFRRRFSMFRSAPVIILCRRSTLLQNKPIKLTNEQIIRL